MIDAATFRARRAAVAFLAEDVSRALRALERHRPRLDGTCSGCGWVHRASWPCLIHRMAVAAFKIADTRVPSQRTGDRR